jgi:hypothetical protein
MRQSSGLVGWRLRGEFIRRSRFLSLVIISQGPGPRTARRSAHSVMRNRDHALCV